MDLCHYLVGEDAASCHYLALSASLKSVARSWWVDVNRHGYCLGDDQRVLPWIYVSIYIYMVPCPVFPPPPHGMGGVWCPCGGVYTYIHTYIPTYIPTYIHTYIPLHYLTLHYLTLHSIHTYIHYITLHTYIHACMHTYIHTNIPTYQHTNIPTYQHTNIPTYHHHRPQGGGTRRTIPPPQATGGGTRRTRRYCPPIPIGGGGGGWPTLHHIYIYRSYGSMDILPWYMAIYIYKYTMDIKFNGSTMGMDFFAGHSWMYIYIYICNGQFMDQGPWSGSWSLSLRRKGSS